MKIETKEFYYISYAYDTLPISNISIDTAGIHKVNPLPILWNNKGLFCIISRQKVQNVLDLIKDQKNLPVLNQREIGTLHWEEGVPITAGAATILLS